jgi:hypothetical protein
MAPAKHNCPAFSVFLTGSVDLTAKSAKIYGILIPNRPITQPASHARNSRIFYILLCMFNGFAFARPFCQAIKVSLTGVEF